MNAANDVQLTNGLNNYVIYSNGTLKITSYTSNNAGDYYCVSTDSHGSVRSLNGNIQTAGEEYTYLI